MPKSFQFFKTEFKSHMVETFNSSIKILDVGPGCGTYSLLLRDIFKNIDCVEIWEPYVHKYKLKNLYNNVFIDDIQIFNFSAYDYLIFGDIIEHLEIESAQKLLNKINLLNKKCMVAVPFMFKQGEHYGNKHETHLQNDLTHDIFLNRYPYMKLLKKLSMNRSNCKGYAYYTNY